MKRLVIIPLVLLCYFVCVGTMRIGTIYTEEEIFPGRVEREPMHYAEDRMDYVEGGITFTYPTDHFSEVPTIDVTVELKDMVFTYSITCVALVTANSAAETTVRVHRVNEIVEEAVTDEVTVNLYATGAP